MTTSEATAIACAMIYREGALLDAREWQHWLALYLVDAIFWVPAWRDEDELVSDPNREISLIYHTERRELEERVTRILSRQSVTAMPLLRTTHFASNITAALRPDGDVDAQASFMTGLYNPRSFVQSTLFGRLMLQLTLREEGWRIARKTVQLQNDCVASVLDFYMI